MKIQLICNCEWQRPPQWIKVKNLIVDIILYFLCLFFLVEEDDVFQCGKCKRQFTTLGAFINHKQSRCLPQRQILPSSSQNVINQNSLLQAVNRHPQIMQVSTCNCNTIQWYWDDELQTRCTLIFYDAGLSTAAGHCATGQIASLIGFFPGYFVLKNENVKVKLK